MTKRVVFTEEADDDVLESYNWYESCEPGLGEEFIRCVEAKILTIQRHPLAYPVALDEYRRAVVRRFPFEIFYEPRDEEMSFTLCFTVRKTLKNGVIDLVMCNPLKAPNHHGRPNRVPVTD